LKAIWVVPVVLSILILVLSGLDPAFATPWGASLSGNGSVEECYVGTGEYGISYCKTIVLYDISGSYSFDINNDNSIQGSGTAQVTLEGRKQSCPGTQTYPVSFSVSGNYSPNVNTIYGDGRNPHSVSITISNPNPSTLSLTQHCDYTSPGGDGPQASTGNEIFDETIDFPSPFNFQHDFGSGGLQMGVSASGEFSMGNGNFWMGSDINSLGSYPVPDTDGDGVSDDIDQCPRTPKGVPSDVVRYPSIL